MAAFMTSGVTNRCASEETVTTRNPFAERFIAGRSPAYLMRPDFFEAKRSQRLRIMRIRILKQLALNLLSLIVRTCKLTEPAAAFNWEFGYSLPCLGTPIARCAVR